MRRVIVFAAGEVYEWANRYVDPHPLSYPYYVIAIAAAKVLDALDPIPPRPGGVSGS